MIEVEQLACIHCGHESSKILESRMDIDLQICQRKYRCYGCNKPFYVLAQTTFHYEDDTLIYSLKLKHGKISGIVSKIQKSKFL